MKRIHKLEANISNKIAAGEVVERPAAVVKELVENAIDAGATKITIEIKKAGKALIRVTDNGGGIDPEDVDLAFERHATSKIETVDDIYKVATLGFRGEALASISAVSNMEVITRQAVKETGVKLIMSGGRRLSKEETGCPVGTTMVVKDLFFNTPARLKFLKSDNAEITAISDIVNKLALSHSEVGFRYIVNDKNMFATPGKGDLFKSIYAVYEKEMTRNLIPIDKSENGVQIKGFMTSLQYTRGNRSMQNFFVNGRYVKSPILMDGVSMAYRSMLTPGRFPACFIMVEIDHTKVDVNIHPAKTEIKFHQEGVVKQIMYTAVRETLLSYNQTPVVSLSDDKLFKKVVMEESTKVEAKPLYEPTKIENPEPSDKNIDAIRSHPVYENEKGHEKQENDHNKSVTENKTVTYGRSDSPSGSRSGKAYKMPAVAENTGFDYKDVSIPKDAFAKESTSVHESDSAGKIGIDSNEISGDKVLINEKGGFGEKEVISSKDVSDKNENLNEKSNAQVKKDSKEDIFVRQDRPKVQGTDASTGQPDPVQDPFMRDVKKADTNLDDIAVINERVQHKAEIYQGLVYIGQMFTTYLIFEKDGRMYLIDQHAAHEKILYERLLKQYRRSALDRQILLDPILIELSYQEHASVLTHSSEYEKLGLAIDDFGGHSIVIREIPALLDRSGAQALFRKAADRLKVDEDEVVSPTSEKLEKIMQESCKTAIKAHDHMADIEVDTLIDQLSTLHDPYTCPHGRPIIISITKSEIEKKFKRT